MSAAFRFKQFTVTQSRAAMKVCTDSCLFGAWAAEYFNKIAPETVIDIGTGTGLLSLMLAQKTSALITAVELDPGACEDAKQNFDSSPFAARLDLICGDIRELHALKPADAVICNPPFYKNDLRSPDEKRNAAMHSAALQFDELAAATHKLLTPSGEAAFLIPASAETTFISVFEKQELHVHSTLRVAHSANHTPNRAMLMVSRDRSYLTKPSRLDIRTSSGDYSKAFEKLLQEFYLA